MKSYSSFLSLFLFLNVLAAQSSHQFLPEGVVKQWNVVQQEFFEPITFTTVYRIGKDTILTTVTGITQAYKQLELTTDSTYTDWEPTDVFLYEPPFSSQLYQYNSLTQEDQLLYDFNMDVGDSIQYSNDCILKVTAIDSIELLNGAKRKRLTLENILLEGGIDLWIEGIGSVNGLLRNPSGICYLDGYSTSVNCYYENREKVYQPHDRDCFIEIRPERTTFLKNGITKQWNVASTDITTSISTTAYRTGKDTIIIKQGLPYKQIESTSDPSYENWTSLPLYFRELDYTDEVYLYDDLQDKEFLLYDFRMKVGNSIDYFGCKITVMEIDTISLLNGELRKRWKVKSELGLEDYWIEGIGSISGVLYGHNSICSTDAVQDLNCYFEDAKKLYSLGGECFIVNTKEFPVLQQISIFPNPVNEYLQIDLSEVNIPYLQIHIFSSLGQEAQQFPAITGQVQEIEVRNLASGVYFLSLEKGGQVIWSERFFKK